MGDDIVRLNVGGEEFWTTQQTMLKHDGYLAALVQCPLASRDAQGRLFVDRDGALFRVVLNYLRTGPAALLCIRESEAPYMLDALLVEADFYALEAMRRDVVTLMQAREDCFDDAQQRRAPLSAIPENKEWHVPAKPVRTPRRAHTQQPRVTAVFFSSPTF